MVKLLCVFVGGSGSAFSVDIDESDTAGDLKDAIKQKNASDLKSVDADQLRLYLAKRNHAWLTYRDPDVVAVEKGEVPDGVAALMTEEMDETLRIDNQVHFGKNFAPCEEDIHVLVDIRDLPSVTASPGIPTYEEDNGSSMAWLSAFRLTEVPSHELPSVGDLAAFVQQDLPVKIGVRQSFLTDWTETRTRTEAHQLSKLFTTATPTPCLVLIYMIIHRVVYNADPGDGVDLLRWFWDIHIRNVLNTVLSPTGQSVRIPNRHDSTGLNRPDFLFTVGSVAVLRGKEQAPGTDVEASRRELCETLTWTYGDVPYLFGYASVDFRAHLYAIVRNSALGQVDTVDLGSFGLNKLGERFRFLLAILHISRLLRSIASLCPASGRDEYKRVIQSNGVEVRLEPTRVVKIFPDAATFNDVAERLLQLYVILKRNQVPNVDRLVMADEWNRRLDFEPRGTDTKPSSLGDLFHALRDVLSALVKLHEASWMHRDIRWSNVIKRRDGSDSWFLIDFDDAAPSPQDASSGRYLSKEEHAPEIHREGHHTTAVDMWSVGYLIHTSGSRVRECWFDLGGERTAFREQLMHADPSQRPTASEALDQLALLEQHCVEQKQQEARKGDSGAPTKRRKA